jgi:chromosome segregation ATPase
MDEPVNVLSELRGLRRELKGQLKKLTRERSRHERKVQALSKEIEHKRSVLEEELKGQQGLEGGGRGASTQVRGSTHQLQDLP